jgi:hypothetical protein
MNATTTTTETLVASLGSLFLAGATTELSYMTDAQADAARALEAELLADAAAGVDLRIRLVAHFCGE